MKRAVMSLVAAVTVSGGVLVAATPSAQALNRCPTGGKAVKHVSYTLSGPSGTRTASTLLGNVRLGDHIVVTFTVPATCASEVLSIASYNAPTPPPYSLSDALSQTLFSSDTGTFTPGVHSLSVDVPPDITPSAVVDPSTFSGTTLPWDGVKSSPNLPCQGGGHWVLAPSQGVTDAILTVNGVTYQMTQNGGGSYVGDSAGPLDATTTASATYQGTSSHVSLELSHCTHFQVDFVQHDVEDPPQYRLTGGESATHPRRK